MAKLKSNFVWSLILTERRIGILGYEIPLGITYSFVSETKGLVLSPIFSFDYHSLFPFLAICSSSTFRGINERLIKKQF